MSETRHLQRGASAGDLPDRPPAPAADRRPSVQATLRRDEAV